MEPVSTAIGLVASITSIAKACRSLYGVIGRFINAPQHIIDLSNDLEGFAAFLDGIAPEFQNGSVSVNPFFEQASALLEKAQMTLSKLQEKVEDIQKSRKIDIQRIKWVLKEQDCSNLRKRIFEHQGSLDRLANIIRE